MTASCMWALPRFGIQLAHCQGCGNGAPALIKESGGHDLLPGQGH